MVENVEVNVTQPDGRFKMQTTSSAGLAHVEVDVGNKHDDLEIQVNSFNYLLLQILRTS